MPLWWPIFINAAEPGGIYSFFGWPTFAISLLVMHLWWPTFGDALVVAHFDKGSKTGVDRFIFLVAHLWRRTFGDALLVAHFW